ncbi:MAG TPA: TonB-dependent receptor, partial [Pyrinomonadaceae bacterium]|nr:TonB-dependent receptor [Pyrinomonadaceae bacterium]
MKPTFRTLFLLVLPLLLSLPVLAQTHRASVRGTIYDPNKAVVPGASITITNVDTRESRTTTSGDDGEYGVSSLLPGRYQIEIERTGFIKQSLPIELLVNEIQRYDVTLNPAGPTSHAPAAESEIFLNKDSASLGTVIENRQVTGLPLDGRNFYELSLLVPGAVPPAQGSAGSVRGDFAFSVNGAREDANNFLLDGVYNIDPKLNTFGVRPSVDAIREFEMLTSTYDASFGRNPGAQVNVVLKSGTNDFHGSLFEFHRNAALDARNFFAPANEPKPKYLRNQFGGAIGGPIIRDRTFFFADYEGTRSREGITRITNVPTAEERVGNFSNSLFGVPTNPFTGMPFDGGVIPEFFQNSVGRAIAALYPLPNRNVPFQNFVSSPTLRDDNDSFDVRVDNHLTNTAQLAFRYSFGDRDLFEPFTGPSFSAVPGFGDFVKRRSQNAMVAFTWVATPNLVNETRGAFSRVASSVTQEGSVLNSEVGLPTISPRERDLGLSFITITGFSPLGDEGNNPQKSVTNVYQFLNNASYVRSNHMFKFGADIRFSQQNAFRDVESRGRLQFSPFFPFTGNALADMLLGFPLLTSVARVDNPQQIRTESYNLFINDSWRVTPRLTLTAGLRYEYNSPPVDAEDRATVFDLNTRQIVPVGTNGVPRSGFEADKNNFAPRVGFAWSIN